MSVTAVLDIGKTHVKVVVVDARGSVLERRSRPNEVISTGPYPHFDTEGIFEWAGACLAELARVHPIATLIPITHGASAAICTDRDLALPVLDYEAREVESVSPEYETEARRFDETASPRLPAGLNLGRQIFWLERQFPEIFARGARILTYPGYWAFRFSGVASAEVTSLGCHTDLWAPAEKRFSRFAEKQGYARRFPDIVPAWQRLGPLREEIATRFGISGDIQVLAGIHDSNASYLAYRVAREKPFCLLSTGTWVVCMASEARLDTLRGERDMLANVDALGSPVACSRFMGGREYHALAGDSGFDAAVSDGDIAGLISGNVMAFPQFATEGGPFLGREGRVSADGWLANATPARRAALASLYTALVTDYCLDLLGASGEIIVDGAFAQNSAYLGILAALRSQQTVLVNRNPVGTGTGAAALAAWPERAHLVELERAKPAALVGVVDYRQAWREQSDSSSD